MDIDARFVKDLYTGNKINIIQFIAHLGLVDGAHYYIHAMEDEMHSDNAHSAAHRHFDAIADEFDPLVQNFLAQVYCRGFMQACAYAVLQHPEDMKPSDVVRQMVTSGELELHFVGLESTASQGKSTVLLYDKGGHN